MVLQSVEKSIEALPAEVKAGAYYEVLQLLEASAEQDRLSSIAAAMYAAKASADKAVKEVTVQRKADIETRTRADAKAAQDAAKDVQRKAEAAADAVGVAIQAVPMAAAKLKHVNSTCKGVNACIDLNAYANGTLVRSKWDVKALAETSDKIHKEAAEGPVAKTLARALKAKEAAQSDVDEAAVALANVKVLVARANDAVELSKAAYTHADNLVANVVDKLEVAIAKLPVAHAASTYEDLLTRQQGVAMKKRTWAKEVANDIAVFAASAAMKKAIAKGTARDVVQMQKETGIAQNALLSAEQTLADAVQAETEAAGMVVRTAAIYKSFKVSCAVVPPGSCIDDFWNHALRSYERIDKVKASAKAAAKAVETKKAATDDREKKTEDAMKANDVYVAAVKKQGAAQAEADQAAEDAAAADSLAAAAQGKHDFTADAAAAAAVMVDSLLSKLENKLSALSHRTAAKEFAKVVNTLAAAAKEDKLTLEEDKKKVADAESDEVLKKELLANATRIASQKQTDAEAARAHAREEHYKLVDAKDALVKAAGVLHDEQSNLQEYKELCTGGDRSVACLQKIELSSKAVLTLKAAKQSAKNAKDDQAVAFQLARTQKRAAFKAKRAAQNKQNSASESVATAEAMSASMKVNKGFAAAWESKARDRLDKATEAAKAKAASPQGADEVDQDISSAGSLDALEAKLVEAKTAIRTQQIAAAAAISAVASAKVKMSNAQWGHKIVAATAKEDADTQSRAKTTAAEINQKKEQDQDLLAAAVQKTEDATKTATEATNSQLAAHSALNATQTAIATEALIKRAEFVSAHSEAKVAAKKAKDTLEALENSCAKTTSDSCETQVEEASDALDKADAALKEKADALTEVKATEIELARENELLVVKKASLLAQENLMVKSEVLAIQAKQQVPTTAAAAERAAKELTALKSSAEETAKDRDAHESIAEAAIQQANAASDYLESSEVEAGAKIGAWDKAAGIKPSSAGDA